MWSGRSLQNVSTRIHSAHPRRHKSSVVHMFVMKKNVFLAINILLDGEMKG
jgi:hypothetical protein